jgi:AraC-like DNA-binding protein
MPVLLELEKTDVLADMLDSVRLRGRVFCRGEFAAPWAIGFSAGTISHFHVVESGQCWLRFDDGPDPIQIGADDVIVIPRGSGYQLADDPRTPSIPLSDIVGGNHGGTHAVLRLGGGGAETRVICGAFEFLNDQAQSLLGVLPRYIQVGARTGRDEWLDATVTLLRSEIRRFDEGTATIVGRLTDIIFIQAVRAWLRTQPEGTAGWLGALRDAAIGTALRLLHTTPARAWTVSDLAEEVGMSRSPFAARFTTFVGVAPLSYLARWRMQLAAGLLATGTLNLTEVAERVGYESAAAFSRAFKKQFGVAPGAYKRKNVTAHPDLRPTDDHVGASLPDISPER